MPRGRVAVAFGFFVAWSSTLATSALAQEAPEGEASIGRDVAPPPEAIEFYRRGREHYDAGRYREAAAELERALTLDPRSPTLVYNLARVYELLGELDRALEHYRRYQTLLPEQQAREQERADATIRRLEGARSSDQLEESAPVEVEPLRQLPGVVLVREAGVADATFWVTLASGIVLAAVGATFGGLALVERDSARDFELTATSNLADRRGALERAHTFGYVTDVALGLGGAAILGAVLLYFMREQTVERAPIGARVALDVTPHGAIAVVRGVL